MIFSREPESRIPTAVCSADIQPGHFSWVYLVLLPPFPSQSPTQDAIPGPAGASEMCLPFFCSSQWMVSPPTAECYF